MIITTEHNGSNGVPPHIRLHDTVWSYNKFEVRDFSLSYYQQSKMFVEKVYPGRYASHGRPGILNEGVAENVWYKIAA